MTGVPTKFSSLWSSWGKGWKTTTVFHISICNVFFPFDKEIWQFFWGCKNPQLFRTAQKYTLDQSWNMIWQKPIPICCVKPCVWRKVEGQDKAVNTSMNRSSVVIKVATIKNYVQPSNLHDTIKTCGMNLHLNFSCLSSLVWVLPWSKMQKILLSGKPGTVVFLQEAWVLKRTYFLMICSLGKQCMTSFAEAED